LANCHRSYWCINGVNDTSNACIAFVIDTGEDMPVSLTPANTCFAGIIDTGELHASPVSMTPVRNFLPESLTPVKLSKTVL
jgi:hypothetical protein